MAGNGESEATASDSATDDAYRSQLACWMGFSDVSCAILDEIAHQLERTATVTERQAEEAFDHLEAVTALTGMGGLFAGKPAQNDHERLLQQHLQAMLASYVRADYMRQALRAMSGMLRTYICESNVMAAQTLALNAGLQSAALNMAKRMRNVHDDIGLTALRERMISRLQGLDVHEESEDALFDHVPDRLPAAEPPVPLPQFQGRPADPESSNIANLIAYCGDADDRTTASLAVSAIGESVSRALAPLFDSGRKSAPPPACEAAPSGKTDA